jgi:hypothetical protein
VLGVGQLPKDLVALLGQVLHGESVHCPAWCVLGDRFASGRNALLR